MIIQNIEPIAIITKLDIRLLTKFIESSDHSFIT
jgi:hypothetical protein